MADYIGTLVLVPGHPRRYAKLCAIDAEWVEVEFFRSVAHRERLKVARHEFTHLHLPAETRVFVPISEHQWWVGSILTSFTKPDGSFEYEVRFPNKQRKDLPEALLHVRCLDTFADPADILAAGCGETQFFADRRRRAVRRMRALRASAEGLTGLMSSSIDIVPHQAAAARRVLQDPTQRYLLADEVGLGKTIEAGAVIRQTLVDGPSRNVLVLAPAALVEQWRMELDRRFSVADFPGRVEIRSYEQIEALASTATPDLLVMDEAHNVIALPGETQEAVQAKQLMVLARQAERLLLLSATPPVGDEDRLLGLLNLLDPSSHPLADRTGFQRKVEKAQDIGRLLLPLAPGRPAVVLQRLAQQALGLFPDDPVVQAEAIRLVPGADRATLDDATEQLREHVIRTYRLHDRLIRTRRTDASLWFQARGPAWPRLEHVRLEFCEEAEPGGIGALLEAWHLDALSAPDLCDAVAVRWTALLGAAWCGPSALGRAVNNATPLFPGEDAHLAALSAWANEPAHASSRTAAVIAAAQDLRSCISKRPGSPPAKIVCFASDAVEADALAQGLRRKFGVFEVLAIGAGASALEAAAAAGSFQLDRQSWMLVCSRSGEEGLNLQFAHGVVHADAPFSASRMEQRIGRLDRFGRRSGSVLHRVVLPDDDEDAPWRAWFDLLANGFRVFSRSCSDVQFRLGIIERRAEAALFAHGAAGLAVMADEVQAELVTERTKLDEQHALDDMARLGHSADSLVEAIEAAEDDEQAIADDLRPWISEVLGLRQHPPLAKPNEPVRFLWSRDTLLPETPWRNLLQQALDRPSTWHRTRAQSPAGLRLSLLRPGAPLFDALERIARWDDRGVAYATWRVEPGWPEMFRCFRLVWVVEPSIPATGSVWLQDDASALRRQAESLLPTATHEQVVDETGAPVTDPALLAILARSYRDGSGGRGDINLGSRPRAMAQAVDAGLFRDIVTQVRAAGEARLRADAGFAARQADALRRHRRDALRARSSLQQRDALHRAEFGRSRPGHERDLRDLDVLETAIREPSVRLDEIGFLVVAGIPPLPPPL